MRQKKVTVEAVPAANVYLDKAKPYLGLTGDNLSGWCKEPTIQAERFMWAWQARERMVDTYAWAIPNEQALETIAKYGPILEIGAGTGYWASLLQARGVDVLAYDTHPPNKQANCYHTSAKVWFHVAEGGVEVVKSHPDRTLMLCWPPFNGGMAKDALRTYKGSTVIYIGEWGGCTADEHFHTELESKFTFIEQVHLPTWEGVHDRLYVYTRKQKRYRRSVTG